ncbi:MAG: YqgE/AlgH family protein [Alphaproteobacteria bacterium]
MNVARAPLAKSVWNQGILTSLKGQLLVATAELNGSVFERSIIYMVNHDSNGAMGVVVNKPFPKLTFSDVVRGMNIEDMMQAGVGIGLTRQPIIMKGGPVDPNRGFVLHSGEYKLPATIEVNGEFGLSATAEIVSDIAKGQGPRKLNFCLGYAGWGPGQLDNEMHGQGWLIAPADRNLVFDTPADERYTAVTRHMGLNSLNFSEVVGQA